MYTTGTDLARYSGNVSRSYACRNVTGITVLFFSIICLCCCTCVDRQGLNEKLSKSKLLFQYCYSCGYFENFQEYGNFIQQTFPGIVIEGQEFNPSSWWVVLANAFSGLKIVLIVCVLQNVNFFPNRLQYLWLFCQKYKFVANGSIYFVCTYLEKTFLSSGAFEIFQNGTQIWSTLQIGRLPQLEELLEAIKT
ncbi:hypothetical protein R5R35_007821 [Gryllus longicercus]|uniref:Selenoprotein t n=1 Tax=Gryllus longicercus TaxID=2509291 RepID=A0AAN9WWC1_9ORTH